MGTQKKSRSARPGLIAALAAFTVLAACQATKVMTPEEQSSHAALLEVQDDPSTPDVDERAEALAQAAALEDTAAKRQVSGIVDMLTMFIPGSELFKPGLAALGLLAFPRVRRNGKRAAKKLAQGSVDLLRTDRSVEQSLGELSGGIQALLATVGLVHSDKEVREEADAQREASA